MVLLAEMDCQGEGSCFGKRKSSGFEKHKQGLKCLLDFPRHFGSLGSSLELINKSECFLKKRKRAGSGTNSQKI